MSETGELMGLEQALAELQDPQPEVRIRAIRRLRVIGGPQAVAAIMGALDDPDAEIRARAAIVLGQMKAREVVPTLIERLKRSPSDEVQEICVFALAEIGDPRAVPPLLDALQDTSEPVINLICAALAKFGDTPQATEPQAAALMGLDAGEESTGQAPCQGNPVARPCWKSGYPVRTGSAEILGHPGRLVPRP